MNDDSMVAKEIRLCDEDIFVMLIANYLITKKNYNPMVVHGVTEEIWLENMQEDYKIVRLVSHHIQNNEQLNFDAFKSEQILNQLRKKTFCLTMRIVTIYTDISDDLVLNSERNHLKFFMKNRDDIKKNKDFTEVFPDVMKETDFKEKGIELLMKVTSNINEDTARKNFKVDKLFSHKTPVVTYIFILICLFMFMLTKGSTDLYTLTKYGANYTELTKQGEYYRLLSSIFIHIGFIHLLFNVYALYIIGPQVEDFYGKFKYFIIFIISGLSGSILSVAFNPNTVAAGASGAIFGLMGALLYFGYYYRSYLGNVVKGQILPLIAINLIIGFSVSGIDNAAHIGGLIGGILTAMASGVSLKGQKSDKINGVIVLILYLAFIIYLAFLR